MRKYFQIIFILLLTSNYSFAKTKEIILTSLDWEPYIGEKLHNNGPLAEILKRAFELEGYELKIIFYPWIRAVNEAEKAHDGIDGYFPEYYDKSKEANFIFSDSFFESEVGLLINKNKINTINYKYDKNNLNNTYSKMYNLKFGVVRGYINEEKFDANKNLKKIESVSDEKNLMMLDEGNVDAVMIDKHIAHYYLKNNPDLLFTRNKFVFLTPPIYIHKLFVAWSKSGSDVNNKIKILNNGLEKLKKSGEILKMLKKHDSFN